VVIITALDEELAALSDYFDLSDAKFFQEASLAYYYNADAIFTPYGQCYSVAITCLNNQMGNTNAGIVATHAMYALKPSYIFMFGIAGGFKNQVDLADVILPDKIIYCALGKQTNNHEEIRPEPLRTDAFLLKWLHTYQWLYPSKNYNVKIGPFAVTEQVIAKAEAVADIQRMHPKMIGIEMESYGVGLAAFKSAHDVKFMAIRGVSDHADDQKNDSYRNKALSNAADFLMGFLKSGLLPKQRRNTENRAKFIAIQHLSLYRRSSISQAARTSLDTLQAYDLMEIVIDQTGLFVGGSLVNPAEALHQQRQTLVRLDEILEEFPDSELGYFGLAHTPLMFHMGYKINRREIQVFGNDYHSAAWFALPEESDPPDIIVEGLPDYPVESSGDVIVLMHVSYPIFSREPEQFVPDPLAYIHIRASKPREGIVDSKQVLDDFTDAFRMVRQSIISKFPDVEQVHLFYAGPPTLAFRCGQQINPNIDPDYLIYNYSKDDDPRYRWALNLRTEEVIEKG
jgi:nucleoside phosphorylase